MSLRPQPSAGFGWIDAPSLGGVLQCEPLGRVARHCFTSRPLRLAPTDEDGWTALARSVGVQPKALVRVRQVHGADVLTIRAGDSVPPVDERPEADIIASNDPEVALVVLAADCVPLLVADPVTGAAAAGHAGWRGTASHVARRAVGTLQSMFAGRPGDFIAAVGPSIGPCCYDVGGELIEAFERQGHGARAIRLWFQRVEGRYRLDLWRATRDALEDAGVEPEHILVSGLCTATHHDWFWSYRVDGRGCGRQAGVVRPSGRGTG